MKENYLGEKTIRIIREQIHNFWILQETMEIKLESFLMDLNSKNGTFLNGKKISENMSQEIAENDIIRLANVDFVAKFVE